MRKSPEGRSIRSRGQSCPARWMGGVAGGGVRGSIRADPAEGLIAGDLIRQVGPYGSVANPAAGDLDGPESRRFRFGCEVDPAPVPPLRPPGFPGQPIAIAGGLLAGAVDQQVRGAGAGATVDVNGRGLPAAAMAAEVWHRPAVVSRDRTRSPAPRHGHAGSRCGRWRASVGSRCLTNRLNSQGASCTASARQSRSQHQAVGSGTRIPSRAGGGALAAAVPCIVPGGHLLGQAYAANFEDASFASQARPGR